METKQGVLPASISGTIDHVRALSSLNTVSGTLKVGGQVGIIQITRCRAELLNLRPANNAVDVKARVVADRWTNIFNRWLVQSKFMASYKDLKEWVQKAMRAGESCDLTESEWLSQTRCRRTGGLRKHEDLRGRGLSSEHLSLRKKEFNRLRWFSTACHLCVVEIAEMNILTLGNLNV